ncbi:protein NLRC5 isoform X3 [Cynoglossus semilaevis]|uniref:protein NLRC5 isoform X3 n=1 Tax=Cynoglossus semilaevis TaxID=244447 RepID=UPI000D62AD59|nr:protein NLRC5 isoform X3 [Cynoglossus semilaevis]
MDEEFDPYNEHENVKTVLAQEYEELLHVLSCQPPEVIMELCKILPNRAAWTTDHGLAANTGLSAAEVITAMLKHLQSSSNAKECCSFLQSFCLICENIPMRLESRLMSAAGNTNNESPGPSATYKESLSSPIEAQQLNKRQQIELPSYQSCQDHWQQYIVATRSLLQRRWDRLREALVKEINLESVWVNPRTGTKGRERPDQTPGPVDRGSRTPESDGEFRFFESRVTLETFLQECAGKVTVIVGQAGSGKTLLMSHLGQQWACGLGPIPSSSLFVLLEFRQLNLLSSPRSLSELLFHCYLPPDDGDCEKSAIVNYLLANPGQSCWVLDGYDEFYSKLSKQEVNRDQLDPETSLPVADLITALLSRQLLPGCTVLVTCRLRDVVDLEAVSDKVGQLVEWERPEIEEYVDSFFEAKGDSASRALGPQAADLLLSDQHLLAMASVPVLCNICCICLKHLLERERDQRAKQQSREGETEGEASGLDPENRVRRAKRSVKIKSEGDVSRPANSTKPPRTRTLIPSTLTQVYLTLICAFLSRDKEKESNVEKSKTQSCVSGLSALSLRGSELSELSQLAWKGLEESKILFLKEDIDPKILEFSVKTGILSQVELRLQNGRVDTGYCFIHLTIQEFLAALRIMTSSDVIDAELRNRVGLKTRWTTRSDQRTVFTDSLHLFLCGLASKDCTAALVDLAQGSGRAGVQNWVLQRQALVLKLLKNLCSNNTLTGPKILDLCHCIQESQDQKLASTVLGTRSSVELRNIRLSPKDINALAFAVNSVGEKGVGLDFGSCSMELECLDLLQRCRYLQHLSFRSRRYDDRFAEKLSSILPNLPALRKLDFCGASLTSAGAASLASALEKCLHITDVNVSDNSLRDDGIRVIADVFDKLPGLMSVKLSRNNSSLKTLNFLIGKMSSCSNVQDIHADAVKELTVRFCPKSNNDSHQNTEPTVSLLNQKWSKTEMQNIAQSLVRCSTLSVLDLSGGSWTVEILETLTRFLPKFSVSNKIMLNDSCPSVDGLIVLTTLLSKCPAVKELHIRLKSGLDPAQVTVVFPGGSRKPAETRTLCLSGCGLQHTHLERLWKSLGKSCDVTELDLSSNCLRNRGLQMLLDVLPRLSNIQEINVSNNGIDMEGVAALAQTLSSYVSLSEVDISDEGGKQVMMKFRSDRSDDKQKLKLFRITHSSLRPSDVTTLCRKLASCRSELELHLSRCSLKDAAVKSLLRMIPKMTSLQRIDISNSVSSPSEALTFVSCLKICHRISSVELRPGGECSIILKPVKAEQTSCSFTQFHLNEDNVKELTEILQQGPQLSYLDLSNNQLGDEEVKCVMDSLPRLNISCFVNLSNNRLTQQGLLDVVQTMCTYENISSVEISIEEEARCLLLFCQQNVCEKTLSIKESSLRSEHLTRLSEIVSHCPSLTTLELKNNSLQPEWIEDLMEELTVGPRGCRVSIQESWMRAGEAVSLLCRCLELSSNIQKIRVNQSVLELCLMKPSGLTSFSLVDCALEQHHLSPLIAVLQRCLSLTALEFSNNTVGTEGVPCLLSLFPQLTSVSIVSNKHSSAVVEALPETLLRSLTLQHLNLSGHVIGDAAAQKLTAVLPRLRSLNLSHCSWSAAGGLQLLSALTDCVSLEELCLDSVQLDEDGLMCLSHVLRSFSCVRSLRLNEIVTSVGTSDIQTVLDLLTSMEDLTHVEELELSQNLICDQSGDRLLQALNNCVHLEELQ